MIQLHKSDSTKYTVSKKLIIEAALQRGWSAYMLHEASSVMLLRTNNKTIKISGTTPQTTSIIAATIANDKFATHNLLNNSGFPSLETVLVSKETYMNANHLVEDGIAVVKPLDGSHGQGITVNVNSQDALKTAISHAVKFNTNTSNVIVQKMYTNPVDIRILCINYAAVAACVRKPASVIGDGLHTVKELIHIENANNRGEPYISPLAYIDAENAQRFLGDAYDAVPKKDETIFVAGTANVGAGGTSIEIFDNLPSWLKEMAQDISRTMELSVCGVDFMVSAPPELDSTIEQINPIVTEVNKSPSFGLHVFPNYGKPIDVTAIFLNYLETL